MLTGDILALGVRARPPATSMRGLPTGWFNSVLPVPQSRPWATAVCVDEFERSTNSAEWALAVRQVAGVA